MQFGLYLVKHGMITANQFVKALEAQLASRPQIGALAIESGKLSVKQIFSILRKQADMPQEMFGELAVQSGAMTEDELILLLYQQSVRTKSMPLILGELGFAATDDIETHFAEYRLACGAADKMAPKIAIEASLPSVAQCCSL